MIILGIDLGKARTGVAICDKGELLASPLTVVTEYHREQLVEKLAVLAKENKAELLAVGLPRNMDGSEGPRAELCRAFARQLEVLSGLPVHLWDERRTTVEAHQILSQQHYHGKKRKNTVDAVAASLILEGYLSFLRR